MISLDCDRTPREQSTYEPQPAFPRQRQVTGVDRRRPPQRLLVVIILRLDACSCIGVRVASVSDILFLLDRSVNNRMVVTRCRRLVHLARRTSLFATGRGVCAAIPPRLFVLDIRVARGTTQGVSAI